MLRITALTKTNKTKQKQEEKNAQWLKIMIFLNSNIIGDVIMIDDGQLKSSLFYPFKSDLNIYFQTMFKCNFK